MPDEIEVNETVFLRSPERGFVEACIQLYAIVRRMNTFRAHPSAASLKRDELNAKMNAAASFPRSPERGFVEASMTTESLASV